MHFGGARGSQDRPGYVCMYVHTNSLCCTLGALRARSFAQDLIVSMPKEDAIAPSPPRRKDPPGKNPAPPPRKGMKENRKTCLVGCEVPKLFQALDARPMARAHKHGFLMVSCADGVGGPEVEPVMAFVVLRAAAIEWYVDEVTARTAGPTLGELGLSSRSVVHEEGRASTRTEAATHLLRVVCGHRELQLEADSRAAIQAWLESIRLRLSALGADADKQQPAAPPRAHEKPAVPPRSHDRKPPTAPSTKEPLLPQGVARSDDARTAQARWLSAQEADYDIESPSPDRRKAKQEPNKGRNAKQEPIQADVAADAPEVVTCFKGYQMRASHIVLLVWLLGLAAVAEGAYIVLQ